MNTSGQAQGAATSWVIATGPHSIISVSGAAEIVLTRVLYIASNGSSCNQQKLLAEAISYARLLRNWARENEPTVERPIYDENRRYSRPGGKPGPMSDG